jgi:hypothetical protein
VKGFGYVVSTVSVILLTMVAWKGVAETPELKLLLIAGAATSIIGMIMRYLAHRHSDRSRAT